MHELDAAINKAKAGESGVQNIDAAWALFVGGDENHGLFTVTMKRANEFGTKITCDTSKASAAVLKALTAAQKAAAAKDVKGLEAAKAQVQAAMTATFAQAIITYAHEIYLDNAAKINAKEHQTEAYTFFRTIAPLVAKANSNSSEALDFWLFPGAAPRLAAPRGARRACMAARAPAAPAPAVRAPAAPAPLTRACPRCRRRAAGNPANTPDVDLKSARALASAYKGLGITSEDVGVYGRKQPDLGCAVFVPQSGEGQEGILAVTDAKDSLRPTEGAAAPAPKAAAPKAAAPKAGGRRLRH